MINVGDTSGCLKVIRTCDEIENEYLYLLEKEAEEEWNKFNDWYNWEDEKDFKDFYHLDSNEANLYNSKANMPRSFIEKYTKYACFLDFRLDGDKFYYHQKAPNTKWDLVKAIRNNKVFEVQCNICGRTLFTDEESFTCRKPKSCKGAECLSTTLTIEQDADYNNNLFDNWDVTGCELQITDSQLAKIDEISSPLTYYGKDRAISIAYISDIHLVHHKKYFNSNNSMIRTVVDSLYNSCGGEDIILFNGDTSTDVELNVKFYKYFMRRNDYKCFLQFKKKLNRVKGLYREANQISEGLLINQCKKLSRYIERRKNELKDFFDYSIFERYRENYRPCCTYEVAFQNYKQVSSYKKYHISERIECELIELSRLIDRLNNYDNYINSEKNRKEYLLNEVQLFEKEYSKSIDNISIQDYKHQRMKNVYVTLGNHEYVEFENVNSGVLYYGRIFADLGITFLHNSFVETDKYLIYGGTGFAGFNEKWNADNIICCPNFSRENEKVETDLFVEGYKEAYQYAKEKGLCFICVSHYPIESSLGHFDREAIYFTGHNHINTYIKSADIVLYADNQIGYKDNNISFRNASTGIETNPYAYLADGLYKTSINDYLRFYRYLGEDIGKGNVLYQRCQNGKSTLYVVKRRGYYGFFIVTPQGKSKGISIVNGGVTKKITNSTDISWICDNFEIVLSKYLHILMPLRAAQERLSEELCEIGFSGRIHGCIVDIDFYHHIMLNPADGSLLFYFSPYFGCVEELSSFKKVFSSIRKNQYLYIIYDAKQISEIEKKYRIMSKDNNLFLSTKANSYMIETESEDSSENESALQIVSRTEGMYGVSRKVNPLQRLFSGHVLRDFDLRLTETEQKAYRKKLYTNERFYYEGVEYIITQDDGNEIVTATEVISSNAKNNDIILTGNTRKFAITALKAKLSKGDVDKFWIR